MLLLGIITLVMTIPLASVYLSSILIHRIAFLILLLSGLLSYNTLYVTPLSTGVGLLGGLFQTTLLSQSLEIFILILGSIILLLVPEGKNYKLNTNSTLSTDFAISSDKNIGSENNETSNLGKYWDNITSNVKGNLTTSNLIETGNTGLKDYPLIILFTTLGMSSLISCSDLITMFLA